MKVTITLSELLIPQAKDILDLAYARTSGGPRPITATDREPPAEDAVGEPVAPVEPKRKKRRTKSEMEEARAAKEEKKDEIPDEAQ